MGFPRALRPTSGVRPGFREGRQSMVRKPLRLDVDQFVLRLHQTVQDAALAEARLARRLAAAARLRVRLRNSESRSARREAISRH